MQLYVVVQLNLLFRDACAKVLYTEHDLLLQKCEFRSVNLQLTPATPDNISSIQVMADEIWRSHYTPIIGQMQVNYMLDRFYSTESMVGQMLGDQQFYRFMLGTEPLGFMAIENRGRGQYFLNKFYVSTFKQRLGIGMIAMEILLANHSDLCELRLQVNRQNFKAINFYFKCGFVIERVADFDIGDGYFMNDFVMLYCR